MVIDAQPGESVHTYASRVCLAAHENDCEIFAEFNGTLFSVQPGNTEKTIYALWFYKREREQYLDKYGKL